MHLANVSFWVLLGAVVLQPSAGQAAAEGPGRLQERPNIILCMTDDQGWGDTSYNGHKVLKTPELDKMAASGLRFNRFYAAAPLCSPTRGSVLAGRHPNRFGCFSANFSIRPEEVTLAEALRSTGYAVTGHFGKWHLGPVKADSPVNPNSSGFSETLSHDNWFDLDPQLCHNGGPPWESSAGRCGSWASPTIRWCGSTATTAAGKRIPAPPEGFAISLVVAQLFFCAARAQEPGQDSQKLILGFEKEELLRTECTGRDAKPGKDTWFYLLDQPQGFDFAARFEVPGQTNRVWNWTCRPGDHTQGELALVASVGPANPDKVLPSYRQTNFLSYYYPSLKGREAHLFMTTFQWFAKGRPDLRDWRGYELLRIDARSDGSPLELRLALEDDVVEPPVVATYSLPQGRWMTIELDLGAAVRARELDLSRMANFWLLGVAQRATNMRLDNVRLAKRGTPAILRRVSFLSSGVLPTKAS